MLRLERDERVVVPTGFGMSFDGIVLDIEDHPQGAVSKILVSELDDYGLNLIRFKEGDVVIDVGAHVGVPAIYLAKKHPNVRIFAYEPVMENFERLLRNLAANDVTNVIAINKAVTADGRDVVLKGNPEENSGGFSILTESSASVQVEASSVTLADTFAEMGTDRCRLLKMDVEGAEHEILTASAELLDRVDYLSAEVHMNQALAGAGHSVEGIVALCQRHISPGNIRIKACGMAK